MLIFNNIDSLFSNTITHRKLIALSEVLTDLNSSKYKITVNNIYKVFVFYNGIS